MKKQLIALAALMLAVSVFFACKTPPKPVEPEPVETPPPVAAVTTPEPPAETFTQVGDRYYHGLILDGAKSYVVVWGDTLTRIAKKQWGAANDPYFFPVFILASQETISDPDLIEPGMRLTIPDLKVNLADPSARANIKAYLLEVAGIYERSNRKHRNEMVKHLTELSGKL